MRKDIEVRNMNLFGNSLNKLNAKVEIFHKSEKIDLFKLGFEAILKHKEEKNKTTNDAQKRMRFGNNKGILAEKEKISDEKAKIEENPKFPLENG